jgi:hypothetical protein
MPLARPFSSKPSSKRTCPSPASISATRARGNSYQQWWRAGRGRGTERVPLSAMRCKFQPHACISARSFHIGRVIWFLALVANGATSPPKPKLPRLVSPWATTPFPFGRRGRDTGSSPISEQSTRFSPKHVFPRGFRSYREGDACS